MKNVLADSFNERLRNAVSFAWDIFSKKVGNQLLHVNKEASMQLHYAYILQQLLPLICLSPDESALIELETGVKIGEKSREIDLLLTGYKGTSKYVIAIEMKCYRKIASSGGNRGATDIFMKDVYEDIQLLESYCNNRCADVGVSLVMNDLERLVSPKKKDAKCWDYDISQGTKISDVHLTTPIGGKDIDIKISKAYHFDWIEQGEFWFLEMEGSLKKLTWEDFFKSKSCFDDDF